MKIKALKTALVFTFGAPFFFLWGMCFESESIIERGLYFLLFLCTCVLLAVFPLTIVMYYKNEIEEIRIEKNKRVIKEFMHL